MNSLSLRLRLTLLIIAVMVAVLIPLGVISYQRESLEMNRLLDDRLAQAGHTLGMLIRQSGSLRDDFIDSANFKSVAPNGSNATTPLSVRQAMVVSVNSRDYEPVVGFQAYYPGHRLTLASANLQALALPTAADMGYRNLLYDGHHWRTFTLKGRSGLVIRIAERYDNRKDITQALILEHMLPLLIGLPLLALLVSMAVRRGMRPVESLIRMLDARTPGSHQPVALEDTPPELVPLIATLNQQFEQLEDALEREHRFNADVAHELRTPLTATMIHLERATLAAEQQNVGAPLHSAQQSLARLGRRIEQILAMARLEAGAASKQRSRQDLVALATEVIEDLAPLILAKDVALSLNHDAPQLHVLGHEAALGAMFRNLIENALRYVPHGGQVEVALRVADGHALIDISDDGHGIPAERREFVFERFHREARQPTNGYGLGLSIVKRAAELHAARIELLDSPFGHGLHVRISMPLGTA